MRHRQGYTLFLGQYVYRKYSNRGFNKAYETALAVKKGAELVGGGAQIEGPDNEIYAYWEQKGSD